MSRQRTQWIEFGKDFCVSSNWHEFSGKKPVGRHGHSVRIYLKISGYTFDPTDPDASPVIKANGRIIDPIVRVIDSDGETYPTQDSTCWGSTIGLKVLPSENGSNLTSNQAEIRIAIRSDESFQCKSIGWHSHQ